MADKRLWLFPPRNGNEKTKRTDTLADFFARSPLRGSKLRIERIKGGVRPTDL